MSGLPLSEYVRCVGSLRKRPRPGNRCEYRDYHPAQIKTNENTTRYESFRFTRPLQDDGVSGLIVRLRYDSLDDEKALPKARKQERIAPGLAGAVPSTGSRYSLRIN